MSNDKPELLSPDLSPETGLDRNYITYLESVALNATMISQESVPTRFPSYTAFIIENNSDNSLEILRAANSKDLVNLELAVRKYSIANSAKENFDYIDAMREIIK